MRVDKMTHRPATFKDFIKPEFVGASVDDFEVNEKGKVVRRDRFKQAFSAIISMITNEFQSDENLDELVEDLFLRADITKYNRGWLHSINEGIERNIELEYIDIITNKGSVLIGLGKAATNHYRHIETGTNWMISNNLEENNIFAFRRSIYVQSDFYKPYDFTRIESAESSSENDCQEVDKNSFEFNEETLKGLGF
jgi:hypothetical protein